ncbi:MAG: hypothetical protein RIQ78_1077 [Bacteroidota bacterium]
MAGYSKGRFVRERFALASRQLHQITILQITLIRVYTMNRSFYLMFLFLVVVFAFNTNSFYTQLSHYLANQGVLEQSISTVYSIDNERRVDQLAHLMGADTLDQERVLLSLVDQINQKFAEITNTEQTLKAYNLFISFFVVALTGLATLFSSYQQFKNPPAASQRFAVWVLILTFVSTIGNSAALHLNNEIETVHERSKKAYEIREGLFANYAALKENQGDVMLLKLQYESYISGL